MADEAIDQPNLEAWFSEHVAGAAPPLAFERISGGRSNLTYAVADADGHALGAAAPAAGQAPRLGSRHGARAQDHLRPPGHRRPRAADRRPLRGRVRERRALLRHGVRRRPDPALALGGRGRASTRPSGARSASASSTPWSRSTAIDPDRVGLGDLGRKEDYVARQLRRWQGQWEKSKTHEVPLIDDVHSRLAARIPEQGPATIVHGDYRLDNMILSDAGEVAAVVDWELCTLGDPLADVGMLLVYWSEAGDELTPLFEAADHRGRLSDARRGPGPLRERSGPRPLGDRLLRRARLLEARRSSSRASTPATPPASTASPTRASSEFAEDRRAARRGRRRGRAPAG